MQNKTILVVEDEVLIALDIEQTLKELGYRTLMATSMSEAIETAMAAEFDVALLDLSLKGESSQGVAVVLKNRGIPFIITSGSSGPDLGDIFDGVPQIGKPFASTALAEALMQIGPDG